MAGVTADQAASGTSRSGSSNEGRCEASSGACGARVALLDRLELGQLLRGGDSEVGEAARSGQHAALERADGVVVGDDGALEPATQLEQVARECPETVVELLDRGD